MLATPPSTLPVTTFIGSFCYLVKGMGDVGDNMLDIYLLTVVVADLPRAIHCDDDVPQSHHFLKVGGGDQQPIALDAKLPHKLINVSPGSDINAARRFDQNNNTGLRLSKASAKRQLLLIATTQVVSAGTQPPVVHPHPCGQAERFRLQRFWIEKSEVRKLAEAGRHQVFHDTEGSEDAFLSSVARNEHNIMADRLFGRAEPHHFAVYMHRSAGVVDQAGYHPFDAFGAPTHLPRD